MEKLLPRWEYGLFLGVKRASGELIIMSLDGVKIVRSARRVPVEDRWGVKALEWVKLVPWNLGEKDSAADGDIPDGVQSGPAREFTKEELESVRARPTRSQPRELVPLRVSSYSYRSGRPYTICPSPCIICWSSNTAGAM